MKTKKILIAFLFIGLFAYPITANKFFLMKKHIPIGPEHKFHAQEHEWMIKCQHFFFCQSPNGAKFFQEFCPDGPHGHLQQEIINIYSERANNDFCVSDMFTQDPYLWIKHYLKVRVHPEGLWAIKTTNKTCFSGNLSVMYGSTHIYVGLILWSWAFWICKVWVLRWLKSDRTS